MGVGMGFQNLLKLFKDAPSESDGPHSAPSTSPWSDPAHPVNQTPTRPENLKPEANIPIHSTPSDYLPDLEAQRELIVQATRTIFDPEIPVNIYDLGLIYEIHINDQREALIRMTLTAPNCPSAEELPVQVRQKALTVPGITGVNVELVWEPAWNKDMMTDVARLELGI